MLTAYPRRDSRHDMSPVQAHRLLEGMQFDGLFSSLTGLPTTLAGYGIVDAQPLDSDLTAIATLSTTAFGRDVLIKADAAAVRTYIGAGTSSFSGAYADLSGKPTLFDGTFASLSGKPTTVAGYGISDAQPLDSDLTAIAALTTDAFGRGLLPLANAGAVRTYIGAGTSSFDGAFASLTGTPTTIAGYGISDFNSLGDARWSVLAHTHTFASLTSKPTTVAGFGITDFNSLGDARWQALDSDLTTLAGLTATTDNFIVSVASAWASRTPTQVRTTLGLVIGTDVQAFDSDLTTWAGITPGANVGTFLATPTLANLSAAVSDANIARTDAAQTFVGQLQLDNLYITNGVFHFRVNDFAIGGGWVGFAFSNTPSISNYALLGHPTAGTYVNCVSGGEVGLRINNSTVLLVNASGAAVTGNLTGTNNSGVGVTAWGTSAAKVLGIGNGTEPSTSPADMVQLYSVDLSAGNATLGIRTERAVVTESVVSDRTLSVRINGTTYKLCLKV